MDLDPLLVQSAIKMNEPVIDGDASHRRYFPDRLLTSWVMFGVQVLEALTCNVRIDLGCRNITVA